MTSWRLLVSPPAAPSIIMQVTHRVAIPIPVPVYCPSKVFIPVLTKCSTVSLFWILELEQSVQILHIVLCGEIGWNDEELRNDCLTFIVSASIFKLLHILPHQWMCSIDLYRALGQVEGISPTL
jgi:hypothetical protein